MTEQVVKRPAIDRLRSRLAVNAETGCHEWSGYVEAKGYARLRDENGKRRLVHRLAYEAAVGPIPPGLTIDHLCRNKRCCNPAHLEPVTRAENTRRGNQFTMGRRSPTCRRGHPFTPDNTVMQKPGRTCRTCKQERERRTKRERRRAYDVASGTSASSAEVDGGAS